MVDLIWKANLEGGSHGFSARNVILHSQLEDLQRAQSALNAWLLNWLEGQTDRSLGDVVDFYFISGEPAAASRGEMLLHMVNHATYHRGWVSDLFFQVPAKPPTTDLSVFMTQARGGIFTTASADELRH